jgi:hypothetical protein
MASPVITIIVFFITFLASSKAQTCGRTKVANSFSIGSEYAIKGQWPWLVPLMNKTGGYHCGSTIVSEKHLLSGKKK